MEKLRPCHVCGNHKLKFVINAMTSRTCVLCEECGEESNWYDTKDKAILDWNRRENYEID